MVGMKTFMPLILGLHLAAVAFAADSCISFNSTTVCTNGTCCPGLICDMSVLGLLYGPRKCLHACDLMEPNCTNPGTNCTLYGGGQCMIECNSSAECGPSYACDPILNVCETCGEKNAACSSNWMCCTGTCTGFSTEKGQTGKCSKGYSLFDMSFSPKQLVGFAVVMVSAVFL